MTQPGKCKWRHLVAKFAAVRNGAILWPILQLMSTNASGAIWWQVAFFLAGEITQVKESISWVRGASGNVFTGTPPKNSKYKKVNNIGYVR